MLGATFVDERTRQHNSQHGPTRAPRTIKGNTEDYSFHFSQHLFAVVTASLVDNVPADTPCAHVGNIRVIAVGLGRYINLHNVGASDLWRTPRGDMA
jgi:hypothetical protein